MQKFQKKPAPAADQRAVFAQDLAELRKHLGGCYAILKRWEAAVAKRPPAA